MKPAHEKRLLHCCDTIFSDPLERHKKKSSRFCRVTKTCLPWNQRKCCVYNCVAVTIIPYIFHIREKFAEKFSVGGLDPKRPVPREDGQRCSRTLPPSVSSAIPGFGAALFAVPHVHPLCSWGGYRPASGPVPGDVHIIVHLNPVFCTVIFCGSQKWKSCYSLQQPFIYHLICYQKLCGFENKFRIFLIYVFQIFTISGFKFQYCIRRDAKYFR